MKGKITVVLLSLVLVFGMIAASCDNGEYPVKPYQNETGNDTHSQKDFPAKQKDFFDAAEGKALTAAANVMYGVTIVSDSNGDDTIAILGPYQTQGAWGIIKFKFPKDIEAGDTFVVTYAAKKLVGTPKVTVKQITDSTSSSGNDATDAKLSSDKLYPVLKTDGIGTLELPMSAFPDADGMFGLQMNNYVSASETNNHAFALKIISIKIK